MRHNNALRRSWAKRVRQDNSFRSDAPSPTFVPLTILRGIGGVAFLCFGELFWVHLSRIGMKEEGKMLGSISLLLGSVMVVGALCGAAGISFSADDGGRLPLLAAVYVSAPLSLGDLVAAITFAAERSKVLRMDLEHEEHRGVRPAPGPPGPNPVPEDDPESRANGFRRLYDVFLFLALAFTVLEALMLRLGRRRLAAAAMRRKGRLGEGGFLATGALESLLDEEDLRQTGWEDWPGESVQQNLVMEQRYEQLRRSNSERNEVLLEHTRGGDKNRL